MSYPHRRARGPGAPKRKATPGKGGVKAPPPYRDGTLRSRTAPSGRSRPMSSSLLRTKPLTLVLKETEDEKHGLRRVLKVWDLIAIGIGCIIGVGIFVLPGVEAANHAGPGIILSFVIAAAACGGAALGYAGLGAMVPVAGSAYTYGYATLGEIGAWIIGWGLVLGYRVGGSP